MIIMNESTPSSPAAAGATCSKIRGRAAAAGARTCDILNRIEAHSSGRSDCWPPAYCLLMLSRNHGILAADIRTASHHP
ncbi:hypothetical protein cyc_00926 [Cyclospora cayetanensis]|uniref:Uncharacterized protein n=1 Tax=Cyclospora cayetanensis TaxID=88456 RepID=A0A1D3D4Y1_9EIME|nr:hypothetical protein cyc_00926 [Cyclospora cayetanensis]